MAMPAAPGQLWVPRAAPTARHARQSPARALAARGGDGALCIARGSPAAPAQQNRLSTTSSSICSTSCLRGLRGGDPASTRASCGRRGRLVCKAEAGAVEKDKAMYPEAVRSMTIAYGCLAGMERTFRFGVPLFLVTVTSSFRPIAILGLIGQLVIFLLGPLIGNFLDRNERHVALVTVIITQTLGILLVSAALLWIAASGNNLPTSTVGLLTSPAFLLVIVGSIVERLSAMASDVAVERDWVTILTGPGRDEALAEGNANLRRLDLGTELVGPLVFGFVLTTYGQRAVIYGDAAVSVLLTPVAIWYSLRARAMSGGALDRTDRCDVSQSPAVRRGRMQRAGEAWEELKHGWDLYLKQPILPASVSYIMLYFNAALSPGGLLTALLAHNGVSGTMSAAFRSACAAMGFFATYVSAFAISRLGVVRAGWGALTLQGILLGVAMCLYFGRIAFAPPGTAMVSIAVFCACVVISRIGLWTYDMAETQIFQTTVDEDEAGAVNTTEFSLCSLAELIMLATAAVIEDPAHFGALALLSALAVGGSWLNFTRWANGLEMNCDGELQYGGGAAEDLVAA